MKKNIKKAEIASIIKMLNSVEDFNMTYEGYKHFSKKTREAMRKYNSMVRELRKHGNEFFILVEKDYWDIKIKKEEVEKNEKI